MNVTSSHVTGRALAPSPGTPSASTATIFSGRIIATTGAPASRWSTDRPSSRWPSSLSIATTPSWLAVTRPPIALDSPTNVATNAVAGRL